jgi:DNA-binding MurR/RpiR family transcriptional regulator
MSSTRGTDKLLLRFRSYDDRLGVTRATVSRLAQELGLNETQVIHYALKRLATDLLPTHEPDDGPLTARELRTIAELAGGRRGKSVRSSLC